MNGGKAMKFTEKETFPPDCCNQPHFYIININQLSKSQLKMKNFIKKSVYLSRNTQIKDKLIHCNAANIVFFSSINRIFSVKKSKKENDCAILTNYTIIGI